MLAHRTRSEWIPGRRRRRRGLLFLLLASGFAPGFAPAATAPRRGAPGGLQQALQAAASAREGWAGVRVTVFFDWNCPACAWLYRRSRTAVHAGRLRLQWIPVAILGPGSLLRAAQWLAAADGRPTLAQAFEGRLAPTASGARIEEMLIAVEGNTALLRWMLGAGPHTPTLVTADRDGRLHLLKDLPAEGPPD